MTPTTTPASKVHVSTVVNAPDPHEAVGLDPRHRRRRKEIERRFHMLMAERNLNLTQLADRLQMSHSYVSRVASGHRTPSFQAARDLARVLEVKIDQLADILL